jgi:hypothetical protein
VQDVVIKLKRAALGAVAAACVAALLAWSPRSNGHGGLSMDEDTCKLRVGRYVMHFVGYQPDSPSGPKEFCEDIPEIGRTIVVLDYVDPELRDLPTEVRVIRDTGTAPQRLDDVTVLHLPPKLYPTGSLNFELNFAQPGKFVGLVTVGSSEKFESRFPFSVGRSRSWLHLLIPPALVIAGSVTLYRFGMRRRAKAAPAPR